MRKAAAMATMGIMTAIAIFPPELRPPDEVELEPEALNADGEGLEEEDVLVELTVAVSELDVSGEYVDVTTTTEGVGVLPLSVVEGVSVTVAVTAITLGLDVGVVVAITTVVDGGMETEETEGEEEVNIEVSDVSVELSVPVTVTVVVGEVVKLTEVVVMTLVTTESVAESVAAVSSFLLVRID
jgi:hypothetical protein